MLHPFSSVPEPYAPLLASLKRFPLTSLQPPSPMRVMVPLIAVALPTDAGVCVGADVGGKRDDGGAGPAARAKLIQPVLAAQSFCAPIQQEF